MATNIERFYGMTHLQEGMLFQKLYNSDSGEYFIQTCMKVEGDFNLDAARDSINLLAVKHDVLRTSFFYKNVEKPKQVVLKERKLEFTIEDLSYINDEDEIAEKISDIKKADIKRGFNLEKGSLLRIKVLKTAENNYRMIWSFHHIIMDGWCLSILFGDFLNFYKRLEKGEDLELIKQEVVKVRNSSARYGDYIKWLERQDADESAYYWKELLKDYETEAAIKPVEGGTDTNIESEEIELSLDSSISNKIKDLSVNLGVTLSHIVESAWGLLLQRYSNSKDVVFGKVVSGRNANLPGIEQMVGLFINTIPERVTLDEGMKVKDFLVKVRTQAVESEKYEYSPLMEIQANSMMGNKLVNTLYVFENYFVDDEKVSQNDLDMNIQIEDAREQVNYDVSLSASMGKALSLKMMYCPQVFTEHEVKLLLEKLESILHQFAENPNQLVDDICVISKEEEENILGTFNDTACDVCKDLTMSEMFEEQVVKFGDRIAVVNKQQEVSYKELNNIANQIAWRLIKNGIGVGDYVAVIDSRSVNMIASILGVLKSGAAYVPIDAKYPKERIEYMITDCNAAAVLYTGDIMADKKENIIYIDYEDVSLVEESSQNPGRISQPSDVAYLIYTSGTTGNPKGVMVEHSGVVVFREYFFREHNITENDRVTQFVSIAFDAMLTELCMSIFSGGTLYLVPEDIRMDVSAFSDFIADVGITALILTPQFIANVDIKKPVRVIITGGSEASPELADRLSKVSNYSNDYGPTECTVCATHWSYVEDKNRKQVPIGKPIINKQIYIMHKNTLCGYGMPGELCIAGDGIARGYLNQEELTNQKFIPNPYGEGKLYRSGDLAMWLPDGNIIFLGRIDEQVKVRGFRVELQEIENIIKNQNQDQVKSVAVIAISDKIGEKQIAAYVVGKEKGLDFEQIKENIRRKLPDFMIPSYFVEVPEIPLTINGKVNKRALPDVNNELNDSYVAPRDDIEEKIASIFANVLDREKVSIDDNFFHIGGHSLRAARVLNQIESELGVKIPLKELFDTPTVEDMARYVKNGKSDGEVEIPLAPLQPRYKMSSMQRRLFMINQMEPDRTIYNMPSSIEVEGDVSKDKVQNIFEQLVARHEALRTRFIMEDGEFYQYIDEKVTAEIEYDDLSNQENWSKEEEYAKFIRPFTLDTAPLMRIKLIRSKDNKHLLFIDMHHIIGDGMTMNILKEEFGALYNGTALTPLRVQYKDYSEWEAKRDLSAQKDYWVNQFCDEIPVLDMKTDFPRPKMQSYKGQIISKSTGKKLKQAIDEYCKVHNVTEYMVLLSCLMILLGKYSRQEDIVIGTPVSGRVHSDTERMFGLFVNTLALRGKPERKKTVIQFLNEIKKCCLDGFENQEFAFDELVESIEIRKDISRNPLFDVMFALQNNEQVNVSLTDARGVGTVDTEYTVAKFDLTVNVSSSENGYNFIFEYSTDLYKEETIENLIQHYVVLLQNFIKDEHILLGELEVIDGFEKALVTQQFNQTSREYPREKSICQLFDEKVAKYGEKNAIVFENDVLTYNELDKKATQIAISLRKAGIEKNDYVAIEAERSLETVICICGIIKAGAAYVPLDCSYPQDRIQYIVDDSSPKVVLYSNNSMDFLQNTKVMSFDEALGKEDNLDFETNSNPEDLAYLIYTSGTTGRPKGVMVEHRNIVNLALDQTYADINEDSIILQTGSLAFDAFTFELWGTLLNGGTLCFTTKEKMTSPKLLKEVIRQHNITDIFMTIALFDQLIEEMPEVFADIKSLMVGGEMISESSVRAMQKYNPHVRFGNIYGPTETTTFAVYYRVWPEVINVKTPIGKPIANLRTYIFDENTLCGVGMPGELCIAGDGLARGYLNNPELTEEKFTEKLCVGERVYRTGDLVCWLPDGNIEFLGRVDEQVKIRGFRIEPGEIKNVILEHIKVQDVAVLVRTDVNGEKVICAYLVNKEKLDVELIKTELRNYLPEYMVPNIILQIDKMPLTVNGKIDKRKLPAVKYDESSLYVAPRDEMEQMLVGIYQQVLGKDKIGIRDNFFELGGHSLRATKVVNQIEEQCGVRIPIKTMFLCPTVEMLAQEIKKFNFTSYERIPKAEEKEYYPMSSTQRRLYIIDTTRDMGTVYNMPSAVVMQGVLDMHKMNLALKKLVERHELLRTSFCNIDGELLQKVNKDVEISVEYAELSCPNEDTKQKAFQDFVRPFSMEQAPLIRVKVVKCSEKENLIFFDMHHIISDGMSMTIVQKELTDLYNGETLPELKAQYKDYSEWIRKRDLSGQKEYWLKQFEDDIPVMEIPLDFPRPQAPSYRGAMVRELLDVSVCNKIEKLANDYGATEYMVYLAAYMLLLGRYCRQSDITIGTPISGRTHRDMESMIGMFVNTLVFRGKPEPDKTFKDFLNEIKDICLKGYENQEYPFEELVENLDIARDSSRNPLFDVMFAFQNNEQAQGEFNDLSATDAIALNEITTKFDINVNIEKEYDGYSFVIQYCKDLFKEETMKYMTYHFKALLEEIVENPERKLKEYNCITAEEIVCIEKFNDNDTDYCKDKTIGQIFKMYAELQPNDIAVEFGTKTLTYQQLDEYSDNIAKCLANIGVRPDDAVAVVAKRSVEIIVGILGIVKLGAAYVPIDESYPPERIAFMLQDCNAKALLTYQMNDIPNEGIPVIDMSEPNVFSGNVEVSEDNNEEILINSENLAYIIYTSGTSGRPKGSLIEQKSILRLVKNTNFINFTKEICVLQTGSISFDASTFELWGPLLNGGKVILANKEILLEPALLKQEIVSRKVNVMWLTAALFNQMVDIDVSIFDTLEHLLIGGEKLSERHVRLFKQHNNNTKLLNGYGPTENTTFTTTYLIPDKFDFIPIGEPIANTKVYVMNNDILCGIGMPGELCTSGAGLSRGYLNMEQLTADKFIDNPFGSGKLYRTGDLVRWHEDGNLEYLGRIDEQVKIRGFRIELTEVESAILNTGLVKESAVIVKENNSSDKCLVAYYVPISQDTTVTELREKLATVIPEYMIPAYMVAMGKMPVTQNGKLNKKALPEVSMNIEKEYVKPSTKEEEVLVKVFQEILGFDNVSITDSFFELGGDSIKAIRVVSKLREYGYSVEVKNIITERVLKNIAKKITTVTLDKLCEQSEVTGETGLSPIQKTFYGWNYRYPNHFNQAIVFKLEDNITETQIEKVLYNIVKHHDALRTVFRNGKQVILGIDECKKFELYSFDLNGMDNPEQFAEQKNTEIQASMDIENGPLVKAAFYLLNGERHFMLTIHHLVVDGVSWRILLEDFSTLLEQINNDVPVTMPAKTMSYKSWTESLEAQKDNKEILAQREYWNKINTQVVECKLPVEETGEASVIKSTGISLGSEETKKLLYQANNAFRTGINDLLLSALVNAFKEWRGMENIAVSQESHGRQRFVENIMVERTVGWFTNMYPIIITAGKDLKDTIIKTKETLRGIPDEGMGYAILKSYVDGCDYNVEPDLCFNYLGDFDNESERNEGLGGSTLSAGEEFNPDNKMTYSISISGSIASGQLRLGVMYDTARNSEKEIIRFCQIYMDELKKIIDFCVEREEVTYTSSDFGTPNLLQDEVQKIVDRYHKTETVQKIYSLTPLQEGMLYYKLLDETSSEYVIQEVFRIQGTTNLEAMNKSLVLIAEKYDSLRTAIFYSGINRPKQVVLKNRAPEFVYHDLTDLDDCSKNDKLEQLKQYDIVRGFDLENDSLLRITAINVSEDEVVILWSTHHIIMDGWCTSLLFKDFLRCYEALTSRGMSYQQVLDMVLEESKEVAPYSDYIKWLERQDKTEGLRYWQQLLDGYDQVATIKSSANVNVSNGEVNVIEIVLDEDVSNQLHQMAIDNSVTMNTVVECAWGLVLQRYNQTEDVVFGKVVSGRDANIKGIENAVGLFINTIPMRVVIEGDITVRQLLNQIQEQSVKSQNYDYCALSEIQECSGLEQQLFDTLFVYENYYVADMTEQSGSVDGSISLENAREETNYPITVSVSYENTMHINIMYNTKEYSETEISRILEHLRQVILSFLRNQDMLVRKIDCLDDDEKKNLLVDFQRTLDTGWEDRTVPEVWEEVVSENSQRVAVKFLDKELTFNELNERVNQLAYTLRAAGVKQNEFVAIMAERSVEMIVAILGVIKAGGAYVPIDPTYPEDRITYMLDDCKPKAVITYRSDVPNDVDILNINLEDENVYSENKENPIRISKKDDLLYMIYTSGTTGRPKGVMIQHEGLLNMVKHYEQEYSITNNDTVLQFASVSFDQSVWDIFGSLLLGAAVCCMPHSYIGTPSIVEEYMNEKNVTIAALTPAYLRELTCENLPKLRIIESGGASADPDVMRKWKQKKQVFNTYGPTEATVNSITYCLDETDYTNIPIGKPISNLRVYIVDKDKLCGIGMPGEICIAGIGLAKGYLNKPELTNEKFVQDPFNEGKMYRTGDLGRWLENGLIEYLGRTDEQVKIRGFRIELGEIETVLKNLDEVDDAVVTVKKDKQGENYIVAYVLNKEEKIDFYNLKTAMLMILPDYMVPACFVQIDSIPLTQNGKVNKRALPEVTFGGLREYVAPETECEKVLVSIFEDVMECEKVSINDCFMDIGGNSIKAIGIVSRIKNAGYELGIKELMMNQTIKEMASNMKSSKEDMFSLCLDYNYNTDDNISEEQFAQCVIYKEINTYDANVSKTVAECTYEPFQYQRNFLENEPDNICPVKIRINGNVNRDVLLSGVQKVIKEQSVLRTAYDKNTGKLIEYAFCDDWYIPYLNSNVTDETMKYADNVMRFIGFFGEKSLLSKIFIVKVSDIEHILYLYAQHSVWDEVSGEALLQLVKNSLSNNSNKDVFCFSDYAKSRCNEEDCQSQETIDNSQKLLQTIQEYAEGKENQNKYLFNIEIEANYETVESIKNKPVEWIIDLYNKLQANSDEKAVPFLMMHHGRKEDQFEQLGMFLRILPGVVNNGICKVYDESNIQMDLQSIEMLNEYKDLIPFVNYYSMTQDTQMPELVSENVEMLPCEKDTGCLLKMGIINNRLFIQMPVQKDDGGAYVEILKQILNK